MIHILIVDDVISAGTSVNISTGIIRKSGANPVGVAVAMLFIVMGCYVPGLQELLELEALTGTDWGMIAVSVVLHVTLVELEKCALRYFNIMIQ